METRLLEDSKT
jgi:acetyl-CoA C-acetyltransferase